MHQLDSVLLLTLPKPILRRIYSLAIGNDGRVEVEVDESGKLSTSKCQLLQVCRQIRLDVLDACENIDTSLRLVYTFRSPGALANFKRLRLSSPDQKISFRLVLLGLLEEYQLTEDETRGRDGPHVPPLFEAWRQVFRWLLAEKFTPGNIDVVFFDFTRSFEFGLHENTYRLVTNLSLLLQRWTHGKTRCQITGCWTDRGQAHVEKFAVNVIKSPSRGRYTLGSGQINWQERLS